MQRFRQKYNQPVTTHLNECHLIYTYKKQMLQNFLNICNKFCFIFFLTTFDFKQKKIKQLFKWSRCCMLRNDRYAKITPTQQFLSNLGRGNMAQVVMPKAIISNIKAFRPIKAEKSNIPSKRVREIYYRVYKLLQYSPNNTLFNWGVSPQ